MYNVHTLTTLTLYTCPTLSSSNIKHNSKMKGDIKLCTSSLVW